MRVCLSGVPEARPQRSQADAMEEVSRGGGPLISELCRPAVEGFGLCMVSAFSTQRPENAHPAWKLVVSPPVSISLPCVVQTIYPYGRNSVCYVLLLPLDDAFRFSVLFTQAL